MQCSLFLVSCIEVPFAGRAVHVVHMENMTFDGFYKDSSHIIEKLSASLQRLDAANNCNEF